MLKEESSSYRIQGISYADEITTPDQNVIDALIKTLNTDKSVNVRLAALYALNKFSDQRSVCDSLVGSLSIQTEPIIQITLINILVDRKEKSAARLIQQIIDNSNTMKEVKTVAEEGVRQLMI
jgi:HEAT repeat protein